MTREFGARPTNDVDNISAAVAPAVTDDSHLGYAVESLWLDTTHSRAYICLAAGVGAAVWKELGGGSNEMATDPLWDAVGDLAVGTGADRGGKLALTVPGGVNLMNVLGVVNGEITPTWKVLFDATLPLPNGAASAGTGVVAARVNHVHPRTTFDKAFLM